MHDQAAWQSCLIVMLTARKNIYKKFACRERATNIELDGECTAFLPLKNEAALLSFTCLILASFIFFTIMLLRDIADIMLRSAAAAFVVSALAVLAASYAGM
jgi:hypothetical protein